MVYPVLDPVDRDRLERKSSILHQSGLLGMWSGGQWVALVNNVITGVKCGRVTHTPRRIALSPNYVDYDFPVAECRYLSDLYLTGNHQETETLPLPTWFGTGFYEHKVNEDVIIEANKEALGLHTEKHLHIGQDHVLAKKTLAPVKRL